ncbi:MAG: Tm-1-like ATP-binding domain-containing protein [Rhodobacteraceae bacterium]|nr:Tm-1-like ATP-binding domain-containing protein [Paracoccaceae bacterium]
MASAALTTEERRKVAGVLCGEMSQATGPVAMLLPRKGCNEWDRPGGDLHVLDCHIKGRAFSTSALKLFDVWLQSGTVKAG